MNHYDSLIFQEKTCAFPVGLHGGGEFFGQALHNVVTAIANAPATTGDLLDIV